MNLQDNPHFTAYALGELSGDEARAMHDMLAATPAAAHELEQIEAVTDALRHGAPIPMARLTHEQRHAVLHPSNLPRRIQPMLPRKPRQRSPRLFWPVMGTLARIAAVATLTGAAFFAGWSFAPDMRRAAEQGADEPQPSSAEPKAVAETPPSVRGKAAGEKAASAPAHMVAAAAVPSKPPAVEKAAAQVKPASASAPAPASKPVATELKVTRVAGGGAVKVPALAAPALGFSMAGSVAFVSTTRQASDQISLHPALIKPLPPKAKGQVFASPQPQARRDKPESRPERPAPLYIHSWKAEIADCPWNAANRLLRIVIQLPADQAAVLGADAGFPLQITFDQANVKQYRMLSERHLAAPELRSAGMHVLWYEFQPNGGGESPRDRSRLIANVVLPNAHFTSQTVGPFDSSRLQAIDRGYSLQQARGDFVFETSVVGFGLLLRGADHLGSLNHDLVLNLARQSQGADATGERARFIRLVQDARQAAGL